MKSYIMVMRDDRFWLVGPFNSGEGAVDWIDNNNPEDDPRWQVLELADPHAPVEVILPEAMHA
jgi:hypothetical protein